MSTAFKVGEMVSLSFGFADRSGTGSYEILRVLPPSLDGQVQYRVRGDDGRERAVGHLQIRPRATAANPLGTVS